MKDKTEIIICDSWQKSRSLITKRLIENNHNPRAVASYDDAYAFAKVANAPFLVILDTHIVGDNTLEGWIAKFKSLKHLIDVIIISSIANKQYILNIMRLGIIHYELRPIDIDRLIDRVELCILSRTKKNKTSDMALDAFVQFNIVDISETGCAFISTFPLEQRSIVTLDITGLDKLFGNSENFLTIRVANCRPFGDKFRIGAEFVGLNAEARSQLSSALYK